jgi:hypothetical protein
MSILKLESLNWNNNSLIIGTSMTIDDKLC